MEYLPRRKVRTLSGHVGRVNSVQFTRSGDYCLSCGQDKTVRLWNPHRDDEAPGAGFLVKTYQGPHGYDVQEVAISGDQSFFASCGQEKEIFLWDVSTSRILNRYYGHDQRVNSICFNADSTIMVSGSYDSTIKVWDLKGRGSKPIQEMRDPKDSVSCVRMSEDSILAACIDDCVRIYDIRAGKLKTDRVHHAVTSLSLSYDGKCVLASCLDGKLRLLDKEDGTLLNEYEGHKNTEYRLDACFTNKDDIVMSGSEDGKIYFWDFVEKKIVQTISAHRECVSTVVYHPDKDVFLSASYDGTVGVWSA